MAAVKVDPAHVREFVNAEEFERWLANHHATADEIWIKIRKVGSGLPSITPKEAIDVVLCWGWIDGIRKSLGDEAYTIRFTPRRKGSIWSKVNVDRFEALKAEGQMTPAGEAAYERDKHRSGVYSYEKPVASLTPEEETVFRRNKLAWTDWDKRPAGYRRSALGWIAGAKRPETRAKRLAELIAVSAEGRRLPQYDWQKKS